MKKKNKRNRTKRRYKLYNRIKKKYHSCFYCGKELCFEEKTIDHIVPLAHDGDDTEENIVIACKTCNRNKSDLTLDEFIKLSLEGYFDEEAILKRKLDKIHSPIVMKIKDNVEFIEKEVNINDIIISINMNQPNESSINSRRSYYLEKGEFNKTAIAEERINNNGKTIYILRQGYINYLILKELNIKTMKLKIYNKYKRK